MFDILRSITPVIKEAQHVKVNRPVLERICNQLTPQDFEASQISFPFDASTLTPEERVNFSIIYNTQTFCFWGDPPWEIQYEGRACKGSYGMNAALGRAITQGLPVLSAKFLEELPLETWTKLMGGNVEIPLLKKRLEILHGVGKELRVGYGGSFANVVAEAHGDALKLVESLASDFPDAFDDRSPYGGKTVLFFKRAQLATFDVYKCFQGQGFGALKNIERLTAFADYKIPYVLRHLGILEYSDSLCQQVDAKALLLPNSPQEVEIRASTIWAVELMRDQLSPRFADITAADVDNYLWVQGKKNWPGKPHHLTLTTAY